MTTQVLALGHAMALKSTMPATSIDVGHVHVPPDSVPTDTMPSVLPPPTAIQVDVAVGQLTSLNWPTPELSAPTSCTDQVHTPPDREPDATTACVLLSSPAATHVVVLGQLTLNSCVVVAPSEGMVASVVHVHVPADSVPTE
jgi:hypothetical protein